MDQPTATVSLGSILDELKAIIAHSDPQKIAEITPYVQGILPADHTVVNLQAGSDVEEKEIMMAFFVDQVAEPELPTELATLLEKLLLKTPMDKLERLGRILNRIKQLEGTHFEWGASKPEFIEDVGHVCYFFIYKQ